ncbi:GntR family transcriptional regulator [Domibacillus aminovorans]|uniref:GntR family transcriptional regulator n=1 Tax=Domibacillus aminovorans TaxID=29332 RepID=A0A177L0V9_9BACI|nr:GntR family transcriptional regulator [Domibacillus aminovorans]OAH59004.1 GntR family transcriptional regulator [Domibacillus aminovorans]
MSGEIETSLLTKQVYDVLKGKIIGRKYNPGEKLDINKIADEFGVSRSPVKDAINQLVHEGLIEIIPRKGTYVTELNLTDFIEVLDARLMIEMWAAQKIIQTVTDEQMDEWEQIVEEMDSLLDVTPFPFELYVDLDMKFHRTLVQWAANKKVQEVYSSLNTHVALSRLVHATSFESTLKRHKDHQCLCEAMRERDLPSFLGKIKLHINSLKKELKKQWDEGLQDGI